jgi:hypothetical protein
MTSTPFDPLESAAVLEKRTLQCPKCRQLVNARKWQFFHVLFLLSTKIAAKHFTLLSEVDMLSRTSKLNVDVPSKLTGINLGRLSSCRTSSRMTMVVNLTFT